MHAARWRVLAIILTLSSLLLAGCAKSKPARFYMLTSGVGLQAGAPPAPGEKGISLTVRPIEFPEYLNRPQIVTRTSPNRIELAEFHRWAEPLGQSFARALTGNLSALLSTERVVLLPWRGGGPADHRITMDVIRFDGTPGGEVSLIARWTLLGPDGNELTPPRRSRITASTRQTGYEGVAEAMSEAVGELSREIVAAIRGHR